MGGTFLKKEIYENTIKCPNCPSDDELQEQTWNYGDKSEKVKFCNHCGVTFKLVQIGGKAENVI